MTRCIVLDHLRTCARLLCTLSLLLFQRLMCRFRPLEMLLQAQRAVESGLLLGQIDAFGMRCGAILWLVAHGSDGF